MCILALLLLNVFTVCVSFVVVMVVLRAGCAERVPRPDGQWGGPACHLICMFVIVVFVFCYNNNGIIMIPIELIVRIIMIIMIS